MSKKKSAAKIIVCDWNRTLCSDYYEETFFNIYFRKIFYIFIRQFEVIKAIRFYLAGKKCKRLFFLSKNAADKEKYIKESIDFLNINLVKGSNKSVLEESMKEYISIAKSLLDVELLDFLKKIKNKYNIKMGILSGGYCKGIKGALESCGYEFDFILSNDFVLDGNNVMGFSLDVFLNKKSLLEEVLQKQNMDLKDVIYIGDNRFDLDCFEAVGYPVCSFLSSNIDKIFLKKRLNIFIPKSIEDFKDYLEEALTNN